MVHKQNIDHWSFQIHQAPNQKETIQATMLNWNLYQPELMCTAFVLFVHHSSLGLFQLGLNNQVIKPQVWTRLTTGPNKRMHK